MSLIDLDAAIAAMDGLRRPGDDRTVMAVITGAQDALRRLVRVEAPRTTPAPALAPGVRVMVRKPEKLEDKLRWPYWAEEMDAFDGKVVVLKEKKVFGGLEAWTTEEWGWMWMFSVRWLTPLAPGEDGR